MFTYRQKEPNIKTNEILKSPLLILLHGFGADENDLFGLSAFLDERFFIASVRAPYSLSYGGYAWFEIYFNADGMSANLEQFEVSRREFLEFVDDLVAEHNLDKDRVFLCGFSQGAMISLSSFLTAPEKFAGIAALSGRAMPEMLPSDNDLEKLKDFPVLVQHGISDQVLPIENGRATKEILSRLPVNLEYKEYEMAHEISQESLTDVSNWLRLKLNK